MQVLGTVFHRIDASVERLMENRTAWPEATLSLFAHMAARVRALVDANFPADLAEHPARLWEYIEKCYEDYQLVKPQLQVIDHSSNLGEADDPVAAIKGVCAEALKIVKDRPAVICVALALALTEHDFDIGSKRRGFFDEHAALVVELEPPLRWFHDRLMVKIIAAIEG